MREEKRWHIQLFGGLTATGPQGAITHFRTQRGALLLALLALHPERFQTREALGECLWPDEDPQRQRLRLRGELSELRTSLGEDIFEKQGNVGLRLREGVTCDVAQFEQHLLTSVRANTPERRVPALEAATALYKGELLPSFYDDRSVAERERLHERYGDLLTRLVLDLEALGQGERAQALRRTLTEQFPERALPAPAMPSPTAPGSPDYVGREDALAFLRQTTERLVTVLGPGGMGKTRLVQEALPEALFASVAEVTDGGVGFFEALRESLRLPKGELTVQEQVVTHLRAQAPVTLILDNLEQLLPAGAASVAHLLHSCPRLRCVSTSRRRLGLPMEYEYPLEPLPLADCTTLFLQRARRIRPDFARTPAALTVVEELVALLEGLPLAIELAAARCVVLGPRELKEQLSQRLRFLARRSPTTNERHQSLRATLDWSFQLLSPELQRVFAHLSLFRGSWNLEAATQVCAACGVAVVDALEELQGHSLISVWFDERESPRYQMLVVVREYAYEQLVASGELTYAQERLADAMQQMAQRIDTLMKAEGPGPGQQQLGYELDTLHHSIDWAIANQRHDLLYTWLDLLGGKLFERGRWEEFVRLMDAVDGHITDEQALMRLCSLRGALLRRQGKEDSAALYWDRWLGLAEKLGDHRAAGWALRQLALQCLDRGDAAGAAHYIRRLEHLEPDSPFLETFWCQHAHLSGQVTVAREQALKLAVKLGATLESTQVQLYYLTRILLETGETETAFYWAFQMLQRARQENNTFHIARMLDLLAVALERLSYTKEAYCAYTLAEQEHTQLSSRFTRFSQEARTMFIQRHPQNAPIWVQTPPATLWHSLLQVRIQRL